MRDVWIYSHIPKCGGTTLKSLLRRSFGEAFRDEVSLLYHKFQYSGEEIQAILDGNPMLECIAGHRFGALMPRIPNVSITVLAQLRDPAERFLSHYAFFRGHRSQNFWPEVKTLSLNEYFQWAIVDGNSPEMANFQTWVLTGFATEKGLQLAEERIRSRELLAFPLSRIDEALVWLKRTQPQRFSDCSYFRQNVRYKVKEDDRQKEITKVREAIREYDQVDRRLLELANQQLDRLVAEAFSSRSDFDLEVEQLRRSNRRLERRELWKRRMKPAHIQRFVRSRVPRFLG